ncbi:MAG: glycoside hydrolase [Tannerellaceae bacterium]|jgi:hypothetical protein|nr:glycoside hydrolase [Tannerellaceae bacterium]
MGTRITTIFFFLFSLSLTAQVRLDGYKQADIHPQLFEGRWKARWISLPDEPANVYGVYHFRKTFEITDVPDKFIVHVSADNRYKLYVNGAFASLGPARGDMYNWNFETVDLSPWLKKGKNTLSAVVWNYAEKKPAAQISYNQTGFILQGNGAAEEVVNTGHSWRCMKNKAYSPWEEWKTDGHTVVGAGELLNASSYPWGWELPEYDDSGWQAAHAGREGAVKGARDYHGRLLIPTPIPQMVMEPERLAALRIAEGVKPPSDFPRQSTPITIPAHTKVRLLLDNQQLTTGYLSLQFSKGKDAEITIGYAEALYGEGENGERIKGNRDEVKGKMFLGYQDKIIADGGEMRSFTTLWWRTWRYVELQVSTAADPLVLDDIYGTFSAYPFEPAYTFTAPGHPELNRMLDIGWRTARLCAGETYMDCPYYEQLQYFGDTRIQAMVTLYNTHDTYMVKKAIEQGRQSIVADGITMSRYPTVLPQFIPSFSLWWICMGHDYWMYRGDEAYLATLLPAYRGILAWFEQWLKEDHSLAYIPYWFFADWAGGFPDGEPVREKGGNSAFQDLIYLLTLEAAAGMEQAFGLLSMSEHYYELAGKIRSTIHDKYWDDTRQLFADTHDHRSFSQHVNSLAVLAGVVSGSAAIDLMERTLSDQDLIQATIYFRYYVHQALSQAGLGDLLLDNLQIWRDQIALGLTTWAEMPEPSRSDCHAWGSSPNIEFYRILLGINSDGAGFKQIRIAPALGDLKEVSGTMPHPSGSITAAYKIDKKGTLSATLTLPPGTTGTFVWRGLTYPLKAGRQEVRVES